VTYNPLADSWSRSRDTDVNYMVLAERPAWSKHIPKRVKRFSDKMCVK